MIRAILLTALSACVLSRGMAAQERPAGTLIKYTYTALGAAVGAVTGVVAGPLLLNPACRASTETPDRLGTCADDLFFGDLPERARDAALFAGIGGGLGLIAGAIIGRERRRKVEQKGLGLELRPAGGGVNLGASLRF